VYLKISRFFQTQDSGVAYAPPRLGCQAQCSKVSVTNTACTLCDRD